MSLPNGSKTKTENFKNSNLLHHSFEVGILIKGIDGLVEIIGGFLLLLVNPARLDKIVAFITQLELARFRHDFIAKLLFKVSQQLSIQSFHFAALYLISHGLFKLFLVITLQRKKLWAYPLAIVFLLFFIIYQLFRYTHRHSIWLAVFTGFDIVVAILISIEYRRLTGKTKTDLSESEN